MPLDPNMGVAMLAGAQNPDAFAQMMAEAGIAPPVGMKPPGVGLASILEPTTGVKAPQGPPPMPAMAPGAPNQGQAIAQQSALMELLMKGMGPRQGPPGLGALLGR